MRPSVGKKRPKTLVIALLMMLGPSLVRRCTWGSLVVVRVGAVTTEDQFLKTAMDPVAVDVAINFVM